MALSTPRFRFDRVEAYYDKTIFSNRDRFGGSDYFHPPGCVSGGSDRQQLEGRFG
jgi:hypothetical protein